MARTNRNSNSLWPRVTLLEPKAIGGTFEVLYCHPSLGGKRIRRSLRTTDGTQARRFATLLSKLIQTPTDHAAPAEEVYPQEVRTAWSIEAPTVYTEFEDGGFGMVATINPDVPVISEKDRIIAALRAENAALLALLKKLGHSEAGKATLPLVDAIKAFVTKDIGGKKRYAGRVECDLTAFSKAVGESRPAGDVQPQEVIDYVTNRKVGNNRARLLARRIVQFLRSATRGTFGAEPIHKHIRRTWSGDSKPAQRWLTDTEAMKLVDCLSAEWQPIGYLQLVAGFRPEELPRIQRKNFVVNDIVGTCRIEAVSHWTPKNKRGTGTVNLPEWSLERLRPLLDIKTDLLFGGNINPKWTPEEEEQDRVTFCRAYCAAIKASAKKAGLVLDRRASNTLRRQCGKRVLLQQLEKRGTANAIEITAAVLRDTTEICREHYADLLPSDVTQ